MRSDVRKGLAFPILRLLRAGPMKDVQVVAAVSHLVPPERAVWCMRMVKRGRRRLEARKRNGRPPDPTRVRPPMTLAEEVEHGRTNYISRELSVLKLNGWVARENGSVRFVSEPNARAQSFQRNAYRKLCEQLGVAFDG